MKINLKSEPETTNKVPHLVLWYGVDSMSITSNYVVAYRNLSSLKNYYDNNQKSNCLNYLIVRFQTGMTGTDVWVLLDTSNGNPEMGEGRSYLWIFKTKKEAEVHRKTQNSNKRFAKLSRAYRYRIVDKFVCS